jgi:hypothetical protein
MTAKVQSLDTKPGVQRDGTLFDKSFYSAGRWVRFQRGRPRKVGGYRQITDALPGPSRGILVNPAQSFNNVFSGYANGLSLIPINSIGTGSGITAMTLTNFTASANNLWKFDTYTDTTGTGVSYLLAHPGQNLALIDNNTNTRVLRGNVTGTSLSGLGTFTNSVVLNSTTTMAVSPTNILIGFGQSITGTGIPANTTVVSSTLAAPILGTVAVTGTAGQMSCTPTSGLFVGQTVTVSGTLTGTSTGVATATTYYIIATNFTTTFTLSATSGGGAITTTAGTTTGLVFTLGQFQAVTISNAATATSGATTITFDNNLDVSGGVVTLHPYVFIYGNNGYIRNNSSGNLDDWVSADANEANVATGKLVASLPVRGGSNSPSGLFWSLDSLVRVSYIGGAGTPPQFWRYDLISSQSSILSSQCVIEYDGIYYWCGIDRFLLYNGVVKEIPNTFNQNYFFDNLNYAQSQKVWVTKIPRFGEIWWFYPRGSATECTDAIVYNIRENCWYDAGEALGARRSAGFFSQVFRFPIAAGYDINATGAIDGTTLTAGGSSYTNGTYNSQALTGGTGTGATANIVVAGNTVTSATIFASGTGYAVGNVLTASIPGGSGFQLTVTSVASLTSLWQHEIGTDAVQGVTNLAIESYFETNDLGWVSGGPSNPAMVGDNRWLDVERVEPDFILSGSMAMTLVSRPYAQSADVTSQEYVFNSTTGKIDLRQQGRIARLRFTSNTSGGDYQLGRILIHGYPGDVRGYS